MTRRVRVWRPLVLLLAAVLAGCGVRPSGVIAGGEAPSGPPEAVDTTLYFVSPGGLVPVQRTGRSSADFVTLLATGPDAGERARGLASEVPASATPGEVRYGIAGLEVSLGGAFDTLTPSAIDQIVCTVLANEGSGLGPVTLRGAGHTWPELTCDD